MSPTELDSIYDTMSSNRAKRDFISASTRRWRFNADSEEEGARPLLRRTPPPALYCGADDECATIGNLRTASPRRANALGGAEAPSREINVVAKLDDMRPNCRETGYFAKLPIVLPKAI